MSTWMVRLLLVLSLAIGAIAPAGLAAAQTQPQPVRLTIVHDTHFHGSFENADRVSLSHLAGVARGIKAKNPNTLFVGNGDDIATSLYSSMFKGEHMIAALNAAGLDADTFGNHEFDLGPDNLRERIQQSAFPWVSANVLDRNTGDAFGAEQGARRFVIREVGGLRVGITGFAPADTAQVSSPGPDVDVLDPIEAALQVVPEMRAAGAQVVLALSHLAWWDAETLAAAVQGVDVIVGDHEATVLAQPKVVNGAIVSRRGDELGRLGQLDLEISQGRIARWTYTEHKLTRELPTDPAVARVIGEYREKLELALGEVVGETATPLDATRPAVRVQETGLGNLIADALRDWTQADVAVQNGGGIRSEKVYEPGPLTRRDLSAILPFANYAAKVRLSGEALRAMLELSVSSVEERHGRFLHVSGLTFSYDPAAPAGSRVQEVLVGGAPLDDAAQYTLGLNDFMQRGGDGYRMLAEAEVLLPGAAGEMLGNVLAGYVSARGTVAPEVEGRIVALGGE